MNEPSTSHAAYATGPQHVSVGKLVDSTSQQIAGTAVDSRSLPSGSRKALVFSDQTLTLEDINDLSRGAVEVSLTDDPKFWARIQAGAHFLDRLLQSEGQIYGVTTGYGDSVTRAVSPALIDQLPVNLTRFLGCGMGEHFDLPTSRAILGTRLASLTQGYSGVSRDLLVQLARFLALDIVPLIPQEGSVGASGDLAPLSYVAAALIGERQVHYQGDIHSSKEVLKALNIAPLKLRPKEGLAVVNGTAVMTALACLAFKRAEYLSALCTRTTALVSMALRGNRDHFDALLFAAKPHPGLQRVAQRIRDDLGTQSQSLESSRLQDRYSVRCAPHVIGVLEDALPHFRTIIENELNSANDNPLLDPDREKLLHGGHFYGGHIAYVMDSLKTLVANLADLMDRQLALLVDPRYSNGLSANLSMADPDRCAINHGFKAVQIAVSAWTAEALKQCMPASVFSRSTECHNQDKVSMGTIAARDCIRVLTLTEQVQSAMLLATTQALAIRGQMEGHVNAPCLQMSAALAAFVQDLRSEFDLVREDRPLEGDLRRFMRYIQTQRWAMQAGI